MHRKHNHTPRHATRPRPLNSAEAILLLRGRCAPRTRVLIHLALATGARSGELASLRWTDIDSANFRIHVRDRKTNHHRTIPVTAQLLELLAGFRETAGSSIDLVFPTRNGRPASAGLLRAAVRSHAVRVCGRPISHHTLRQWTLRSLNS